MDIDLLMWTHRTLGCNFFGGVKLRQGHTLVTEGPYRRTRHPMYTALFLIGVAYFFLSTSWLIGLPWLATIVVTAATHVDQEEEMLADQFGDQYRAYQARTGRFRPRRSSVEGSWSKQRPASWKSCPSRSSVPLQKSMSVR